MPEQVPDGPRSGREVAGGCVIPTLEEIRKRHADRLFQKRGAAAVAAAKEQMAAMEAEAPAGLHPVYLCRSCGERERRVLKVSLPFHPEEEVDRYGLRAWSADARPELHQCGPGEWGVMDLVAFEEVAG